VKTAAEPQRKNGNGKDYRQLIKEEKSKTSKEVSFYLDRCPLNGCQCIRGGEKLSTTTTGNAVRLATIPERKRHSLLTNLFLSNFSTFFCTNAKGFVGMHGGGGRRSLEKQRV
jgi:hypothetical protein